MNATTITKLSMNQLNAEKLVNYLLDNNIKLSGNVLIALLGSVNMYKNIINNYVEENSTVIIVDTKLVNYYIKNITNKNIEIKTINVKENDIKDFILQLKNMPKFDYIIQNPPYNGSTHLNFFEAGLNMLKSDGKMVIIEPSVWLINIRKNGKAKKYDKIKKLIENHVSKVVIENYTREFSVGIYSPFSITYIDKSKQYNKILLKRFGEKLIVNSLYDCNIIGSYDLIWSIINKFNCDKINKHLYIPNKSIKEKNKWYCKYATIPASGALMLGSGRYVNNGRWRKILNNEYQLAYLNSIYYAEPGYLPSITIPKRKDHGGNLIDKEADCIVGTKEELENWRYFVFNNSIPLFISICMTIDQNNNSLDYVPWLVDKKYTDQEIYEMFGFTDEEIKLIETTIKKYERYSPWFKRYMCGPSSVSDEEVQKYIDNLK